MHQDGENETQHREHEAASLIQQQYRKHLRQSKQTIPGASQDNPARTLDDVAMEQEPGELDNSDADTRYIAALVIQNHYRNHLSKKHTATEREEAAKVIQHHYKSYKRRSDAEFEAALQDAVKNVQVEYHSLNETDEETSAATTIQRHYRQHKDKQEKDKAATLIQRKYREHLQGSRKQALYDVVKLMQEHQISNYVANFKRHKEQMSKYGDTAATTIQRHYRQRLDRKRKEKAAILIQTKYREHLYNSTENTQPQCADSQRVSAAIKIQTHYRQRLDEKRNTDAAICIQRKFRKHLLNNTSEGRTSCNLNIAPSNEKEVAAVKIQQHYRAHLDQRSLAAASIQKHYKAYATTKREHVTEEDDKIKAAAATTIQTKFREHLDEKHKKENAAKIIQNQYRIHVNKKEATSHKPSVVECTKPVAKPKEKPAKKKDVKTFNNVNIKKPSIVFEKEWPVSKKLSIQKSKSAAKKSKAAVQTSLEIKREQRRNDKNNKKDRFHLSKLKTTSESKATHDPAKVKADTPQIKQERSSIEPETEPELLVLRESTDERTPSVDIVAFEDRDTHSLLSEEDDDYTSPNNTYPNKSYPNNSNVQPITNALQYHEFHNTVAKKAEPTVQLRASKQAAAAGGNLESYAVQSMLKKNELFTRQYMFQKNSNSSYLHSYLKQMRVVRRDPGQPVKTKSKARQQDYVRRSQPEVIVPGNLEKIARYGRNTKPEEWKSFVNTPSDAPRLKGVSRGSFYPVIPSYGRMKSTTSDDTAELTEIPWPTNIG